MIFSYEDLMPPREIRGIAVSLRGSKQVVQGGSVKGNGF
jgi:hypothetical protein